MIQTNVQRGDIFYADLFPVVGSEQGGIRPVLILQNDIGNQFSPTTIVAPLTSQYKHGLPTHISISGFGLTKESIVELEQVRTVDKGRLKEYVGHLSEEKIQEVESALKISFGLKEETKMNNLTVRIGNQDISIKEYQGKRVVTFKDIDQCHNRPEGTARRNFSDNRQHLISGTDYFIVKPADIRKCEKRTSGITPEDVNNRGTALITESGYLMLVKSFTDDLAWEVQRQLVNTYFRKGAADPSLKLQIQQERAHAMLMNAKTRALKTISASLGDKKLSSLALQVFGLTAIEEVTGKKIDYRPECGKLYSAQQIADEVGSNRITVGKRATAAGLKTDEYGITALSKSEHGPTQVPTFMYNEKGRAAVKELFEK